MYHKNAYLGLVVSSKIASGVMDMCTVWRLNTAMLDHLLGHNFNQRHEYTTQIKIHLLRWWYWRFVNDRERMAHAL